MHLFSRFNEIIVNNYVKIAPIWIKNLSSFTPLDFHLSQIIKITEGSAYLWNILTIKWKFAHINSPLKDGHTIPFSIPKKRLKTFVRNLQFRKLALKYCNTFNDYIHLNKLLISFGERIRYGSFRLIRTGTVRHNEK